jgi:serine/threonine-protein kinase
MDFAHALAGHFDDDATLDAIALARRPRRKEPASRKRLLLMASAILAVLVIAGAAAAVILTGRHQKEAAPQPGPAVPAVPVVLVGADCGVLGAAGVTETGQKAYCARLPSTGDIMWSLVSGVVPTPTVTKGPNDQTFPEGIEQQVDVCIQQTGQTRAECREDVRRGNLSGPA